MAFYMVITYILINSVVIKPPIPYPLPTLPLKELRYFCLMPTLHASFITLAQLLNMIDFYVT